MLAATCRPHVEPNVSMQALYYSLRTFLLTMRETAHKAVVEQREQRSSATTSVSATPTPSVSSAPPASGTPPPAAATPASTGAPPTGTSF